MFKFQGLHRFHIYTPTPSVYAHPIFNNVGDCVWIMNSACQHEDY